MNKILTVLSMVFFQTTSFAAIVENWDRPVFTSTEVQEILKTGEFDSVKKVKLMLTRNDSTLEESIELRIDNETIIIPVAELVQVSCESVVKVGLFTNHLDETYHIQIKDHTQRLCDDESANVWEVYIAKTNVADVILGEIELLVDISPVLTIQDAIQPAMEIPANDLDQDLTVLKITR